MMSMSIQAKNKKRGENVMSKNKGGAKGKYQEWLIEDGLLKLEAWARDGLTDEQIAHNIGIRRTTLYDWKKKYSDISDALSRGKEVVDVMVENALLKRALGYEYVEVTKERIVDTGQKKRHGGQSKLTGEEWEACQNHFGGKCCYCGKSKKLTKDHLKPLKDGGKLEANNILPACQSCNSSKKNNEWLSWFQKQKFYSKSRARLIAEYFDFVLETEAKKTVTKVLNDGKMLITKEVTKQVVPDVTAIKHWLNNRKPDKWREKTETELSGGIVVSNPYEGLTTEELRKLARSQKDGG